MYIHFKDNVYLNTFYFQNIIEFTDIVCIPFGAHPVFHMNTKACIINIIDPQILWFYFQFPEFIQFNTFINEPVEMFTLLKWPWLLFHVTGISLS